MARYLFIGAHPDDNTISCGLTMSRLSHLGHYVESLTVFTALPDQLTPMAEIKHREWGLPNGIADRLEEEAHACEVLGATQTQLGFPEAIYRWLPSGQPRIVDRGDKFGALNSDDSRLMLAVADRLLHHIEQSGFDIVIAPIGAGSHIDHLVVTLAAERAERVLIERARIDESRALPVLLLVEDLPYSALYPDEMPSLRLSHKVGQSVNATGTSEDFSRKIKAIGCHVSQLNDTFRSWPRWDLALLQHARQLGRGRPAEAYMTTSNLVIDQQVAATLGTFQSSGLSRTD